LVLACAHASAAACVLLRRARCCADCAARGSRSRQGAALYMHAAAGLRCRTLRSNEVHTALCVNRRNAMVFFTLYLQLLGMSDFNAALLYVSFPPARSGRLKRPLHHLFCASAQSGCLPASSALLMHLKRYGSEPCALQQSIHCCRQRRFCWCMRLHGST